MLRKIFLSMALLSVLQHFEGCVPATAEMRYGGKQTASAQDSSGRYKSKDTSGTSLRLPPLSDTSFAEGEADEAEPDAKTRYDLVAVFPNTSKTANSGVNANFADAVESMKMAIVKYDQTPYHYGGNDLDGIDCSAFTQNVFQQAFNFKLPRSAREQYQVGDVVDERTSMKFGDLVFFNTRRRVRPGHVGIYLGDNKFVHASSRNGVIISSLEEDYYNRKFMGSRRILDIDNYKAQN